MVPKSWITKLLVIKLLTFCISLANELKIVAANEMGANEEFNIEHRVALRIKEI